MRLGVRLSGSRTLHPCQSWILSWLLCVWSICVTDCLCCPFEWWLLPGEMTQVIALTLTRISVLAVSLAFIWVMSVSLSPNWLIACLCQPFARLLCNWHLFEWWQSLVCIWVAADLCIHVTTKFYPGFWLLDECQGNYQHHRGDNIFLDSQLSSD